MEVKSTLEDVRREFGGVAPFWESLSRAPMILNSCWNGFKGVISSQALQKETKLLIVYDCVIADGCLHCKEGFKTVLEEFGINRSILEKLDGDLNGTNLDAETKDILTFAYYASKNPHRIDERSIIEFKILVGKRKVLETIACMTICKSIMDIAHYLNLHAFEVRPNVAD